MPRPSTSSPDYNAWATLANAVSTAIRANVDHHVLLSEREAIATDLWDDGYRPTEQQVAAEVRRQQEADRAWAEDRTWADLFGEDSRP